MSTEVKSNKLHYAWLIFIGCCFVSAASLAAVVSIVGVYIMPVSKGLGVGPGDWMVWMTICSIMSAISISFWGQLMQTKNIRVVSSIGTILLALAVLMFSFGNSLIWFYVWGAVIGIALPCIATLLVPTLIGNWFGAKHRGKMLGIASAFTGVGTFIWAPLFTIIMQNFGWQTSYMINAALVLVFILPWTLFVFRFKPEDKGLEPYGFDPKIAAEEANMMKQGLSRSGALKTAAFWLVLFAILFTSVGMGFNSNMVPIATEAMAGIMEPQGAAILGASMISVAAVGNIIGKIIFGFMQGRAGLKTTLIVFVLAVIISYALWVLVPAAAALLVGAFLFGTQNALVSVGYPLVVRQLFGHKDFAKIFSNVMTLNALMGGFSGTVISFVYQIFGSYQAALITGIVLFFIVGILIVAASSYIGKIKWDEVKD